MTTDEEEIMRILPLAEQGLQEAASAFREAGQIIEESTARLRVRREAIEDASNRLRKALGKPTVPA